MFKLKIQYDLQSTYVIIYDYQFIAIVELNYLNSAQEQFKLLYLYSIIPNLTIKLISEISINLFNSVFSLPCGREKVTNRKGERKLNFGPSSWSSNVISYPIYVVRSVLCIVSVSSRLLKIYSKYEMMISFSSSKSIVLLLCTCVASSYSTHFLLS